MPTPRPARVPCPGRYTVWDRFGHLRCDVCGDEHTTDYVEFGDPCDACPRPDPVVPEPAPRGGRS